MTGPPVTTAGTWSSATGVAYFTPHFPPVPGTEFAVISVSADGPIELIRATVPAVVITPTTRVLRIDPGPDDVPENLLRFSVTFSAPMEQGSAAGHLRLLSGDGAELPGLLPMPPELWDRRRCRLTVLLEPGRIKRGLQPGVQAGAPLAVGTSVTLVVDRELRDAHGAPLVAGAQRTFAVGEAIRSRIDPGRWSVRRSAEVGGQVVVRFDRSLDRALVSRCLTVVGPGGAPVAGTTTLDDDALVWTFSAARPTAQDWRLRVDTELEDLAGNSVRRVFDRDLRDPDDRAPAPGLVDIDIVRDRIGVRQ